MTFDCLLWRYILKSGISSVFLVKLFQRVTTIWLWKIHFNLFDFIKRIFRCQKDDHWQRDKFTIPCPEEVVITTELSRGLGGRLSCYSTSQTVIVVKQENRANMPEIPEITHKRQQKISTKNETVADSQLHAKKIKERRRSWPLKNWKNCLLLDIKSLRPLLGQKI